MTADVIFSRKHRPFCNAEHLWDKRFITYYTPDHLENIVILEWYLSDGKRTSQHDLMPLGWVVV